MTFCLGGFCGRFHDELDGGSSSDEDEDSKKTGSSNMTGKRRKQSKTRKKVQKKDDGRGNASAALKWAQFLSQTNVKGKARGVETTQQVVMLRVVNNPHLTPSMMSGINQLSKLHTIEMIRCHRDDIPPFLNDMDTLAVLRMSHNQLRRFSDDLAKCMKLEQIILDFNEISEINPGIFSSRTFAMLEVLNLSHNRLSFLPFDFGLTSKDNIKLLDLSNNTIQSLPDKILSCKKLEEINVSHNRLKQLPDNFEFKKLQKLFVSFNELTRLPQEIGKCRELVKVRMVSNQIRELPPSILTLWKKKGGKLDELLVDRNPLIMPSITAFEMEKGGLDRAFHLFDQCLSEMRKMAEDLKALENPHAAEDQGPRAIAATEEAPSAPAVEDAPAQASDAHMADYYFGHCKGDGAKIAEIRACESTMLVIKKSMYIDSLRKSDDIDADGEAAASEAMPDEEQYQRERYCGSVPVQDLDVYFGLMVYSMKDGAGASAYVIYDRFESGKKGFLSREEWDELCLSVSVRLSDDVCDQIFQLLSYRSSDCISENDFIAGWHIHDLECQDPWIKRITEVLRLDYYAMNITEVHRRLKAKDAQDATPQLTFGRNENADAEAEVHGGVVLSLDGPQFAEVEGIRRAVRSGQHGQPGEAGPSSPSARLPKALASLTEEQHKVHELDAMSEGGESEDSVASRELSDGSGSDESEFDAYRALNGAPLLGARGPQEAKGAREQRTDPHMKTDVFEVRRAIRQVYRSMPFSNFVSLINFLLRGMEFIQHSRGPESCWHADDPIFRHALGNKGTNTYTRKLLTQMGFVIISVWWVWPSIHLDPSRRSSATWGEAVVPPTCPGKDRYRLDDMIRLLKSCQMSLHQAGSSFSGHIRHAH